MLNDLYVAFVYLPPLNSSYGKVHSKDIMIKLERQIEHFACKGKLLVCGDLNARVGDSVDLIQTVEEQYIPTNHDDSYDIILPRVSCDNSVVNQTGRWLIDRCVDNQLYILNGRTLGDLTGQFTCHTQRGSSVVDYIIASRSFSNFIHNMNVHDVSLFSDHCLLSTKLKIGSNLCYDEYLSACDTNLNNLVPDNFEWNECFKLKFKESFSTPVIKKKLEKLQISIDKCNHDVDALIENIADIIVSAGDMTLPKRTFMKKKKKRHKLNKKWYDKDCHVLLKEVKSAKNKFNRNKTSNDLRMKYFKKYKEYRKLTKFKRRQFKDNLVNMLDEAMDKDPQKAWKLITELKRESIPTENIEKINHQKWFDHFNNLLNSETNNIDQNRQNHVRV